MVTLMKEFRHVSRNHLSVSLAMLLQPQRSSIELAQHLYPQMHNQSDLLSPRVLSPRAAPISYQEFDDTVLPAERAAYFEKFGPDARGNGAEPPSRAAAPTHPQRLTEGRRRPIPLEGAVLAAPGADAA
ncbi:unnamed protein product, partial [Prorocentrum cordatum]